MKLKEIHKIKDRKKLLNDVKRYNSMNETDKFKIEICYDWNTEAGRLDGHYFLQDLFMAKKVILNNPIHHYDIGSRIDGFVAHLLTTMEVTLIDIRPLTFAIEGLKFVQGDATNLSTIKEQEIESISCLHALEHFGLGRYGDSINPYAYITALHELERVLKKGGMLYLSVPIGDEEKVCFNAHRIFNPLTIIEELTCMELVEFSYIENMEIKKCNPRNENNKYGPYSCGLFIFRKV